MNKKLRKFIYVISLVLSFGMVFISCKNQEKDIVSLKNSTSYVTKDKNTSAENQEADENLQDASAENQKADKNLQDTPAEDQKADKSLTDTSDHGKTNSKNDNTKEEKTENAYEKNADKKGNDDDKEHMVYVHVTGCVKNPGVYSVYEGDRLYQAIELAGGFTKNASDASVNLALPVTDGQQIKILSKKQYSKELKRKNDTIQNADGDVNASDATADGKININSADADKLMSLPGIGKSKADAIIQYREENGDFSTIEDIMNVSGIKEASFNQIKDKITV